MAIQLYRAGDTHVSQGIECEIGNFQAAEMELLLKDGWVKDPKELEVTGDEGAGNEDIATDETDGNDEEYTEGSEDVPAEPELNPVRQAARDAGIDGWKTKRIATLEKALAKVND